MIRSLVATILAFVMALIGIVLAIGGAWLLILGGSPYYLIAGALMLASAWFLFKGQRLGGWIYVGLFALSALWGFAEARGNAWAMIPWLIAPLVLLIAVLVVMASLSRARNCWRYAGAGIAASVLFVLASFVMLGSSSGTAIAALPAASSPGMTDPSGLATGADWPTYGGTYANWRYSPLSQIDASNVGKLRKVWEVHTGGMPTTAEFKKLYGTENTPLKVGNLLYTCTAKNVIVALDAATGKPVWRVDPKVPDEWIPYTTACRGLVYYRVPGEAANAACAARIIEGTLDSRLIAVDALTGKACTEFNGTGQQDTKIGMGWVYPGLATINSAPTVVRGIIVVPHQILDGQCRCSPSGVIQGFDARTGKLAWAWDMQHPDWNGYPPKGQEWARGTPNMWTGSAGDEKLGLVYVPLGNVAADYISTGRSPLANQFSSSVVAIDVTSGKPRWKFQTVAKDVWDYDLGSPPTLLDYRGTPAVVIPSKQGDLYVLDRATGRPLTPIGSIAAPGGGVEPAERAPRQIVSLWNSLKMPDLRESDMWGCRRSTRCCVASSIAARTIAANIRRRAPTSIRSNIPAITAAATGAACRSTRCAASSSSITTTCPIMCGWCLERRPTSSASNRASPASLGSANAHSIDAQWGVPYAINVNAGWRMKFTKLMCKRPPYGGIRAIDVATGKTLWDRPFGTARRNGPFNIPTMLPFHRDAQ